MVGGLPVHRHRQRLRAAAAAAAAVALLALACLAGSRGVERHRDAHRLLSDSLEDSRLGRGVRVEVSGAPGPRPWQSARPGVCAAC